MIKYCIAWWWYWSLHRHTWLEVWSFYSLSVPYPETFVLVAMFYGTNGSLCAFWRYPNLKNVKELIYKKGFANVDRQMVPLTDNNIIEQVLNSSIFRHYTNTHMYKSYKYTSYEGKKGERWKIYRYVAYCRMTLTSQLLCVSLYNMTFLTFPLSGRNSGNMEFYALKMLCTKLLMLAPILRRLLISYGHFCSTSQKD